MADVNLLIAFYSRNGSTEALAKHIASAAEAAGADVRIRRTPDIASEELQKSVPGWFENATRMQKEYQAPTSDDADWADGILFGTPTPFGNVSAELKAYVDSLGGLWFQGKLFNKAAGVFVSTQSLHGGNEATSNSFFNPLAHLGFVIVPKRIR